MRLLGILSFSSVAPDDQIELLQKILAVAERRLGSNAFKEFAGAFWGFIETRPYMRARQRLADAFRLAGKLELAITEWEEMLKLNPNDNQGIRYSLLPAYLALTRLDAAARLFARYDECGLHTVFSWCRVLERFLSRDLPGAARALAIARAQNPFTEAYVRRQKRRPKHLPDAYTLGRKEEAVCFAENLAMAWKPHAQARKWLAAQSNSPSEITLRSSNNHDLHKPIGLDTTRTVQLGAPFRQTS
jgi:tetratricopeptide (TPR) repeat protein